MTRTDTNISVTIITLNEEQAIGACLASVAWADEVIVVDSGSSDRTGDICRSFPNVRFMHQDWLGYGPQKNFALAQASHQWILSLDADETVSPELQEAIKDALQAPSQCAGYRIGRRNFYRGRWIRHSGWWPDEIIRFFKKDAGQFNNRIVHESVELSGPVGRLTGTIDHRSFHAAEDFLEKARRYAIPGALQMHAAGKRGSALLAVIKATAAFIKSYLLKRGFLDGRAGLLIAVSGAVGVFYRVIKLAELAEEE
ncbi:glycosyltransferase family 2 protein [Trichlorobacter ammonificans]|uniref:Lipopolysaccharide core biosynthesis glycosyltransferase KdtX n=1 Tax=Trichlorobacter ammonificans TaxID=2916410 RepID=A0ABM9D7U8_9BACT|nr:glycosyltransferase family 2 protein [Trichlorobacter ammonificans]CAH2030479.1 Lipopolysaccharide core biosynthesis glycosyltransferase KdtX [Trichlorobacter ammonificans]